MKLNKDLRWVIIAMLIFILVVVAVITLVTPDILESIHRITGGFR